MQTITLLLADNGVIKSVVDDNINAAGERYEATVVYDFESKEAIETKIKFLTDVAMDAGLELGNPKDKTQIKIIQDWGTAYAPTNEEIQVKIAEHKLAAARLEAMLAN